MMTIDQVETLRQQLLAEGVPAPEAARQLAMVCLGWPYVYGAWGARCTPRNRGRRMNTAHPTIKSKCRVLSGSYDWKNITDNRYCTGCQWGEGVRMFDCRGFIKWIFEQFGILITGQGATSQYNTASNWARSGPISEMPDCVCCVFKANGRTMEHTGIHIGGGTIIHCSSGVQTGNISDRGWTHYAIPIGLYSEGEIPVDIVKPVLRQGSTGTAVAELQRTLTALGYPCGTADGIFGAKTRNALVSYQLDHNLDPDGVCGRKTWAALDAASPEPAKPAEPEPTYKVIIEGVPWEKYRKILEICPLAECYKE